MHFTRLKGHVNSSRWKCHNIEVPEENGATPVFNGGRRHVGVLQFLCDANLNLEMTPRSVLLLLRDVRINLGMPNNDDIAPALMADYSL